MESKYQRGKIYKIVCNETGLCYVGSTIEKSLANRLSGHKTQYKKYLEGKTNYITSFKVLEHDNYYIELICQAPCNSKDELTAIEGQHIRQTDCVNKRIEGRTKKQYREDNHYIIMQKKNKYYQDNKEQLKKKNKQYYQDNKEQIKKYKTEYIDRNRDQINEKAKIYRKENKSIINSRRSQSFICECGQSYTLRHKARHERSQKHQEYLKRINI